MSPPADMPKPRRAPRVLTDFHGSWQFERWIDDHRAGQGIAAHGTAWITPDATRPDRAVYDEEARLQLPGQAPLHGTRRYLIEGDGPVLHFLFDDGRFFHAVDLADPAPKSHHACAPDSYDVAYALSDWPRWQATWTVRGPRKAYVMRTTYSRAP